MTSSNPFSQNLYRTAAELSAAKQALLERRLSKMRDAVPSPTIENVSLAKDIPMSFGQERMWFLNQFEPNSVAYNIPAVLHFLGPLDVATLERSLNEILRRHQVLRTVYRQEAGRPVQAVREPTPIEIVVIDLQGLPVSAREAEAERLAREEVSRSFDLSDDLMFRAQLIRFADDKHWLIMTIHHIAFDGWSRGVLHDELASLYAAFRGGRTAPLPELSLQYNDYAIWQRDWVLGSEARQQLAWWKQTLQGAATVLELPCDHPRPSVPSMHGMRLQIHLSRPLTNALRDLAMRNQSTLFMVLMATWNVLLHRYTGQDDILVGFPIAGRTRTETEPLIGLFMNTLPLRTNLAGNPTFRDLLSRVREMALSIYSNQEVPLQLLIESMAIQRDTSRPPLFQHMFVLQNAPRSAKHLGELSFDSLELNTSTSKLDLTMELREGPEGLKGHLEYNTDLFDCSTIARMVGHFVTLLNGIVADPDQPISELPLLTEPERHQLLAEWNDTSVDYPSDKCVHQLFEEQAERTPDAVAVVFKDQKLTYRDLNERANQMAHYLIGLGVERETLVGLCVERSANLLISILGILKAGGAYVPLDADYPSQRLEFMLRDSGLKFLVTQRKLLGRLPDTDCTVICLDTEDDIFQNLPRSNPNARVDAECLAYVMYTSGSTGIPKGVEIQHGSIVRLVFGNSYINFGPDRVFVQLATPSFDASTFEIWGALMHGAKLIVAPDGVPDFGQLEELLKGNQVTTLWLTSTFFNQLIEHYPQALNRVEEIITGGEALSVPHISKAQVAFGPRVQLVNGYGPTEGTTFSTCFRIPFGVAPEQTSVPIGRPIANTQVYVLDAQRQPVPIGVPGELTIGGAGLARGYLNRPDITAEKFVPNPFLDDTRARLYRTGDLVRWRADGNLEFLGRIDDQVKLRGFRIELGEIETALNESPDVAQCVVMLREDRPDDKRLVAYCVPAPGTRIDTPQLRNHLRERLPDYMLPAAFVEIERLPLTSSGKVDRRSLPVPDDSRPELETGYANPCNPIEQQLASIWSEVLGIQEIGIHDNFFALGGHSLLATRLNARIMSVLQVELPLRKLFEAPTIAEIAAEVGSLRSGGQNYQVNEISRVNREQVDRLPLSFSQQRLWFLEQMEGELTAYNMPSAFRLHGSLEVEALRLALEGVVRRHEPLRTTFSMIDDEPVQIIQPMARFDLPIEDLSSMNPGQREIAIAQRCRQEAEKPFDLTSHLMLRASLLRLSEDEYVLLLTMHHIASDGWSLRILWRELGIFYDAYRCGMQPTLPDLPVQYSDYAIKQRDRMQGELESRLLGYWSEQLRGAPPTLELHTDRSRPERQSYRGASQSITLSSDLTDSIKRLGQQEGATQFMTLLAAFQLLLSRITGQRDVVVGTPIAGRLRTEYESLIGFFVNTLALRSRISDDQTFLNLLGNVRRTTLEAYDHQELPFDKLVEVLQPDRSLSRSPLVQVLFNGVAIDPPLWNVAGVTAGLVKLEEPPSKFDLTIYAMERNDQLVLRLSYNSELFNPERMACLLDQYRFLLEQVVAAPDRTLDSYSLITPASRAILPDLRVALEVPKQVLVANQIARITDNMPDKVAICQESMQWTYRELDRASSEFVRVLQACEIKKGDVVAICGEPSFGLISSIVGVLKSESILVLIDPKLPVARQRLLLDQAGTHLVAIVGNEESEIDSPAGDRVVLRIANTSGDVVTPREFQRAINPSRSSQRFPDDAAYIFFTSGTTGTPKAVIGSHQGLSHFIQWQRTQFEVGANDRVAQVTKLSFDVVLREIFLPLTSGATLCLPERSVDDPNELWQWLEDNSITIVHGVPSRLRMWLSGLPSNVSLPSFRWLFMAGEALSKSLVDAWRSSFAGEIINLYGPTETTLAKSWYRVPHGEDLCDGIQPIGNALPETQLVLLSDKGRPCGIGEPGEILIRTPFRSHGYLNADQTRERFVPNPFREDANDLLYRSGDMGRYRPDGLLDILGRLDDQVKIGGVRIQPVEIATLLSTYDRVMDCYVGAVSNPQGEYQLVAWVVPSPGNSPTSNDLRGHLATQLPDAMIPSRFVFLDALPLTLSGKLDRHSLPAPDDARPELATRYVAPRTPIEQQLVAIWRDVLGIQEIGIHDNFFALGGHSLLATRVTARVRRELNLVLPLRDIFLHPTVEGSALNILKQQMLSAESSDMENLLNELDAMEEESETPVENPALFHETLPEIADSDFHCPRSRSTWFGKRKCNLVIVLNEQIEFATFERLAGYVRELDSSIDVTIVPDGPSIQPPLASRPTLIFSPAFIRHQLPFSGRVFCGNPLSKSEEYHALEKSGIPVPKWLLLSETNTPDLSSFDEYVVRKPDYGGRGAEVMITRKSRVRWRPITTRSAGTSSETIIQQFIYTGPKPISYRVNTLFGKVLYANKNQTKNNHRELMGPNDFRGAGLSIVASARGSHVELSFDEEIIRFAEHAHSAFPKIPLLGFDIVREVPSGKLYVLEANAIGYVWNFTSNQVMSYGVSFEDQFDGVRKAAFILAEKTQQAAH